MMSVLRLVLVALVLGAAAAGTTPPASAAAPASTAAAAGATAADSCKRLDFDDPVDLRARADEVSTVFVGKVRAIEVRETVGGGAGKASEPPPSGSATAGPERDRNAVATGWQHTVVVTARFRGDVRRGDRVQVVTEPIRKDGLGRLATRKNYLFFADGAKGMDHLTATACGGTTLLPDGMGFRLQRKLNAALVEPPSPEPEPEITLSSPPGGADEAPSLGRVAAPGLALALIGVLGLLLVTRAGSRRT